MLCLQSAAELCAKLRAGEVSSRDLLYLDRYQRFNGTINTIAATDIDAVRETGHIMNTFIKRDGEWLVASEQTCSARES